MNFKVKLMLRAQQDLLCYVGTSSFRNFEIKEGYLCCCNSFSLFSKPYLHNVKFLHQNLCDAGLSHSTLSSEGYL